MSTEKEILFALIRERYGARLTPEQLEGLEQSLGMVVDTAAALRGIRLTNADEPFQPFTPYRADG